MQFTQHSRLLIKVVGIWLILLACIVVFATYFNLFEAPRSRLELLTTITWLSLIIILSTALPKGIWSICFIFFVAFGVFHGGLILANTFNGITDKDIIYQISFWFENDETENAIHLFNISMIGFSLGAIIFSKKNHKVIEEEVKEVFNKRIFHMGGVLLVVMIVIFFAITAVSGILNSYGAYLNLLGAVPLLGTLFAYLYLFIGIGLVLVSVSYRKGFSYIYFVIFALWALFAFKLGLRGEVMFPATVAACMVGRKGAPINGVTLTLVIICFLVLTGIVKNARISGDYSSIESVNPLNAVAEMGASLRAVQEVIKWRKSGDELLYGASYWAPFERQFAWFVPGLSRKPASDDPRLLNVVVQERAGPIGFSPIAEAYMNFGEKGVLIVFFLIGAILAHFDNKPSLLRYDLYLGVSLVPVFIMIRNSFTHVPVQIVMGIMICWAIRYIAKTKLRE